MSRNPPGPHEVALLLAVFLGGSAVLYAAGRVDPDPRGMPVLGCDREQGGVCKEIWVDRAEPQIRYLELEATGGKRVLLPITLANVRGRKGVIEVESITGAQFKNAPTLKSYDQITLAEEDKVVAYYGGGKLYATPDRAEPFL